MNRFDIIALSHQAFINIKARQLRSALAILGVVIGSASVVALLYCGQLATISVINQLSDLGTNLISASITGAGGKLESTSITSLPSKVNTIKKAVPIAFAYESVTFDGVNLNASVVGTNADFFDVAKLQLAQGRFLSIFDQDQFCVIGSKLENGIDSALGRQIKYGSHFCTVVGVLEPIKNNFFIPVDYDHSVILPIDVILATNHHNIVRDAVFVLNSGDVVDKTEVMLKKEFKKIVPKSRVYFRNPSQIIEKIVAQKRQLSFLLAIIGSIALVVGGIGIMNIMLVSVVERKREIGIRCAIGATVRDIKALFLVEAAVLSLFGGILGILFGVLSSVVVAKIASWSWHFLFIPIFLGFSIAIIIGVFFGYYPAVCAAKMNPVTALRSD